ncbi:MAG: SIS domain-containing protein [Clostridiaceae bacterium]|nr:SIS domain-containing protein [Clostridiaceae bacterium]
MSNEKHISNENKYNNYKYLPEKILEDLLDKYGNLEACKSDIWDSFVIIRDCFASGGKLLLCGNGGSAADCEHIVGELMKSFLLERPLEEVESQKIKAYFPDEWEYLSRYLQKALPAISLVSLISLSTAYTNDVNPDMLFAQQVYGYGKEGDVLLGISTSGNSKNVINALKIARVFGLKTIGLTGKDGGKMKDICDVTIIAPASSTHEVQELHLPIYHALCAMLEAHFSRFTTHCIRRDGSCASSTQSR